MKIIGAAALFLSTFVPAAGWAQTPCPATPVFSVTPGDPVLLTISHATTRDLGGPRVEIEGNDITIWQIDFDVPPPPSASGVEPCNNVTASLGTLPSGTYTVGWHYAVSPAYPNGPFGRLESFTFAFSHLPEPVPALEGAALLGLIVLLAALGVVLVRR